MSAFNPSAYRITIVNKDVDGHRYFVGTVAEFPHVEVFEDTWADAYTAVAGIIEDLFDQAVAAGDGFPAPMHDAPAYSGRVTVRVPKWLHQRLDEQAREQDVSLNFHISTLLTEGSNWIKKGPPGQTQKAFAMGSLRIFSVVNTVTTDLHSKIALEIPLKNVVGPLADPKTPATTTKVSYDFNQLH